MTQKTKIIHIITVFVLVFIVLLLAALIINLVRLGRVNSKVSALESKIAQLSRQIEENEDEITLKDSNQYIERYAREHLNMKGRDEFVFRTK